METIETRGDIEQLQEQVERIARSNVLRNARSLQRLLRYLSSCALERNGGDLKESLIGIDVFDRQPAYDPKIDTIVRVQAHRLRGKLKQYYATEGAGDPIIVDIPRGHYVLAFEHRENPLSKPGVDHHLTPTDRTDSSLNLKKEPFFPSWAADEAAASLPPSAVPSSAFANRRLAIILLAGVFVLIFSVVLGERFLKDKLNRSSSPDDPPAAVRAFWNGFLDGDPAPIVVYADATFLLDETNDLFRFRHGAVDKRGALVDPHLAKAFASNPKGVAQAGPLFYDSGYTGTGDLEAVAVISRLVTQLGSRVTVKRSHDLTPDDLQRHNVILLGSSFQNDAVAGLASIGDFRFANPSGLVEAWRAQIQNIHARPGDRTAYQTERDPTTGVLTADYALVSVEPGIQGRRRIMLLGGLDTNGTKGATMFVTSVAGIDALTKAADLSKDRRGVFNTPLSVFQSVVKVDLQNGGGVLGLHLITTHQLAPQRGD
jgi:hypothetical protein